MRPSVASRSSRPAAGSPRGPPAPKAFIRSTRKPCGAPTICSRFLLRRSRLCRRRWARSARLRHEVARQPMNRREAIAMAGAATLSALASQAARAVAAPARVLILGGTGFIGPHFVAALTARGHSVTVFNRGRDPAKVPAGVVQLLGDRDGQLE